MRHGLIKKKRKGCINGGKTIFKTTKQAPLSCTPTNQSQTKVSTTSNPYN
jgi:hypothetical protein